MADWVSSDDVRSRWVGNGLPADDAVLTTLIGDAQELIEVQLPTLDAMVAAGTTSVLLIRIVVVRMVTRVLRNPTGARQHTSTDGPFTQAITMAGDDPGSLYVSTEELSWLAGTGAKGRAFCIDLAPNATPVIDPNPDILMPRPWQ